MRKARNIQPTKPTRLTSLRLPVEDIERAQQIAKKQGIGYQTVLKQAIARGLRKTG